MFFCMAACNPSASVCPSRQQPHRASLYAWEGSSECVHTATHTGVICTHNIADKSSHLDFIHKVLNYDQRKTWRGKSQTLQNTDVTVAVWCTDEDKFVPNCNVIPPHVKTRVQSSNMSTPQPVITLHLGLHTFHRYVSLVFPLQDHQPWGGCPRQYAFQNVKNKLRWAHIPSRNVRLIREINITLPTAVAYTQTRVMSCHLCCVTESSK